MKRLLALALTLSVASCDTSMKAADGTSSETQTALQALADNVRSMQEASSFGVTARGGGSSARRFDSGDSCADGLAELELYGIGEAGGWTSSRTRWAICNADSSMVDVYGEEREDDVSPKWTTVATWTRYVDMHVLVRVQQEAPLGGGFRWYRTKRGEGLWPIDVWAIPVDVVTDGHIDVDMTAGVIANDTEDESKGQLDADTLDFRYPIYDRMRGREKIGNFYWFRGGRVEVRDLDGRLILPLVPAPAPVLDSMGMRFLVDGSDTDSLRLQVRIQMLDPPGFRVPASVLILADSSEVASREMEYVDPDDSSHAGRILMRTDDGFTNGRVVEVRAPRQAPELNRLCLARRYVRGNGDAYWRLAAVITLDGRRVTPRWY